MLLPEEAKRAAAHSGMHLPTKVLWKWTKLIRSYTSEKAVTAAFFALNVIYAEKVSFAECFASWVQCYVFKMWRTLIQGFSLLLILALWLHSVQYTYSFLFCFIVSRWKTFSENHSDVLTAWRRWRLTACILWRFSRVPSQGNLVTETGQSLIEVHQGFMLGPMWKTDRVRM